MAMRETVRSLKAYFIVSGLLGGAISLLAIARSVSALDLVANLVGLGLCIAYVSVGVRLRGLLVAAPRQVFAVLIAGAVFLGVCLLLSIVAGAVRATLPTVAIGGVTTWYLYSNARRLAAESHSAAVAPGGA